MRDTPFFIIGSKRSGTTLLRLMLNKNSGLAIPPESHFIISLVSYFKEVSKPFTLQELYKAKELVVNHPRFNTWNISLKEINTIVATLPAPYSLSSFINALFTYKIAGTGKHRWGEKTPEYIDILPQLNDLFPEAQFIALLRDGRDVAISLKERGWHGWSIYQRGIYWKACVQNILFLKNLSARALFVRYEDLVIKPVEILEKITEFLEAEFESQMLQFNEDYQQNIIEQEIKSGVHTKLKRQPKADEDVYKWKTNLNKYAVWKFETVCYNELELMGYKVAYYNKNNLLHKIFGYGYKFAGKIISAGYFFYHKLISIGLKKDLRKKKVYNELRSLIRKL